MDEITIRKAALQDAEQLVSLSLQLGYETTLQKMQFSLADLMTNADYEMYVAQQIETHLLVGFIFVYIKKSIIEDYAYEILALVVHDEFRSLNIGQKLMAEIEMLARSKNINHIIVRSSTKRERAHKFYLREGFSVVKHHYVFFKEISM